MSQIHKHPIPANIAERCLINPEQYQAQYQQSVTDPDAFWGEQGKILDWMRPYTRVKNTSFAPGNVSIKWYEDGTLNLAANCLDRHLAERGDQTAIIWEGDDASQSKHIIASCIATSAALPTSCSTWALKGDVVAIYMPMVPEAAVAMLACAHRRDPLGHFRRLLAGGGCRTYYRLQLSPGDHRR
jgi:acetyl-CoA synthetase